jgi:hypothetical protein
MAGTMVYARALRLSKAHLQEAAQPSETGNCVFRHLVCD